MNIQNRILLSIFAAAKPLPQYGIIYMRYFITFSYNGTHYHGWQYQPNATSVQETMNKALSTLLNSKVELMGAGRTDTGVHAKIMVAHFDFENDLNDQSLIHRLNAYLPPDIAVFKIIAVQDTAHARFDAKERTYEYHIHTFKNVFLNDQSWYHHPPLDIDLMNQASKMLLRHIDFQCFSKVNTDVNTFNCKITTAHWQAKKQQLVFTITADRFLRNMVRAIVGTLINVGLHKISVADFETIIESRNRSEAGFSVPAHGLYLTEIKYDDIIP